MCFRGCSEVSNWSMVAAAGMPAKGTTRGLEHDSVIVQRPARNREYLKMLKRRMCRP